MGTQTQWIYHKELGWLYLSAENDASVWMYDSSQEWLWTTKAIDPFLYSNKKNNWIYFIKSTKPRKFWDFQTKEWITESN